MSARMCKCGATAIDSETTYRVCADENGDPASYGAGLDEARCYGMGPARFAARDYLEHVTRLAQRERMPARERKSLLAALAAKIAAATLETSPREVRA